MTDTAVFIRRRGGTVRWSDLSRTAQRRINCNRRAMGLHLREITATWDESDFEEGLYGVSLVGEALVGSPERTEEVDVPDRLSA
jgi:hypothetical protein